MTGYLKNKTQTYSQTNVKDDSINDVIFQKQDANIQPDEREG